VPPAASAPAGTAAAPMQPEVAPQASPATTLPVSPRTAPHSPAPHSTAASQSAAPPVRRVPIVPPEQLT
ncbi:PPE family protein, partial [Mycobacterium sp. WUMAC-025]|nr:PPE family protein [Mycobacterium sp. WUMAC-025]